MAAMAEKIEVYRTIAPLSEDEMQWLIESKAQNA